MGIAEGSERSEGYDKDLIGIRGGSGRSEWSGRAERHAASERSEGVGEGSERPMGSLVGRFSLV